jgi:hypothetical protein
MGIELAQQLQQAGHTVNRIKEAVNEGRMSFAEAERRILEYTNGLGSLMTQEILEGVREPTAENRLEVRGRVAVYAGMRNLRFINRFGGQTVRARRAYKYLEGGGSYCPLDEKVRMEVCGGFSPLLSYLIAAHAVTDSYQTSAKLLSETIGFRVSSTAVQRNTELIGEQLPDCAYEAVPAQKIDEPCELMVVEIDGTMTPQIVEKEGLSGRESLKQPTEYKECNVLVIEKYRGEQRIDRWLGAKYGPRSVFEEYVRRCGLSMGQLKAAKVAFIADGAHTNWEIQKTNFPEAIPILDFYHAVEHVGAFCGLYSEAALGTQKRNRWIHMMSEGDVLQMIHEMSQEAVGLPDPEQGLKQICYFKDNIERMRYDEYRKQGLPQGSGLVEGACKFVIGKRFKGSGMRWKKRDNASVLRARLAMLNGTLPTFFQPKPAPFTFVTQKAAA